MYEIDHVAAAVESLDDALESFEQIDGASVEWVKESPEWQYRTAYLVIGRDMFTLIEPMSDESFMATFIEQRGPGLHHLGISVEDLDAAVAQMEALGGEVIMEDTIQGVRDEATFHPRSWFGLQFQLIEWHNDVGTTARDHIDALRAAKESNQS